MYAETYSASLIMLLEKVAANNQQSLLKAARLIINSYQNDGMLHVFGTGHSHMLALELFYRAGGLVRVNPILDEALMLHNSASRSTAVERLSGYAETILHSHNVTENDVVLICSNSGINAVIIELAQLCKSNGAKIVALTSADQSAKLVARHNSQLHLYEVADVVLDNCGFFGDACVLRKSNDRVGPTSTVVGAYLVNLLALNLLEMADSQGILIDTFQSSNVPGGDEKNSRILRDWTSKIKAL